MTTKGDGDNASSDELPGSSTIVLFFFDVLGFSDRVNELGLAHILSQYEAMVAMVDAQAGGRIVSTLVPTGPGVASVAVGYLKMESTYFSDTIMVWSTYEPIRFQVELDIMNDFFCTALVKGLPLRGAITFGEAVMDTERRVFVGEPIIEAARAEAAQRWCGCTFGPSLDRFTAIGPPNTVMPYERQVKPGMEELVRPLSLDWPRKWRTKFPDIDVYSKIDGFRRPGFDEYWDATSDFVRHSGENDEWWTGLDPEESVSL